MSTTLVALFLAFTMQAAPPAGNPASGKAAWQGQMCKSCHGDQGEGGYGPDLAGRGLSLDQFKKAIRQPWGVMPFYAESQLPDSAIADMHAFLSSQPKVTQLGHWHWEHAPADSPAGQRYQSAFGCGQCHEPELRYVRRFLGAVMKDVDFDYFAKQVYRHYEKFPRGRMPNFSKERLGEPLLKEIYKFMEDSGFLAPVSAALAAAQPVGDTTTYTLSVFNEGVVGKGLTAEDLTIFVRVPPAAKLTSATGTGYKGVRPLAQLGLMPGLRLAPHPHDGAVPERPKPDLSGDVAVWELPRLAAGEKHTFTLTLAGAAPTAEFVQGFEGSTVYWKKPTIRIVPGQTYRDLRLPDKGDNFAIPAPRPPQPRQTP